MNSKRIFALSLTGAIALAACQQPTAPTPVPNPAVGSPTIVSATPGAAVAAGGTGTVTVVVTPGANGGVVSSVKAGSATCTPASAANTYTCSVPVPSGTAAGNFPVTITVTNNAATGNTATQNVNLTVSGTTPTPSQGTAAVTVTPIAPVTAGQTSAQVVVNAFAGTGATVKTIAITFNGNTVSYNTAATSSVSGVYVIPVPAGLADGNYPVTVVATDSAGATATAGTSLTVFRAAVPPLPQPIPDPTAVPDFIANTAIRPVRGTAGVGQARVGFEDQTGLPGGGTGALSDPRDVVRVLGQGGAGDASLTQRLTFVKGFIKFAVTPTFAASAVDHVDYKIYDTPDGQAIDYIDDQGNAANGFESAPYDTSNHSDLEGRALYIVSVVVYKNGQEETFIRPFYVDRTAPQAPDPEIKGAPVGTYSASNFLEDVFGPEDNWARGTIYAYTSNPDLKDLPGTFGDGRVTSSLENVSYYFVPLAAVTADRFVCELDASGATGLFVSECFGPALGGNPQSYPKQIYVINPAQGGSTIVPLKTTIIVGYTLPPVINIAVGDAARAAAIRRSAVNPTDAAAGTNPLTQESKGLASEAYRKIVGSGASASLATPAVAQDYKIALDNRFAVFAISRDRLGNSRPSTTYKIISFDNQGPTIGAGSVVDTSPLPFPAEPGFVSDQGRLNGVSISDGSNNPLFQGIGFAKGGVGTVNLGGLSFPISSPFKGITNLAISNYDFDSNQISNGLYNLSVGGFGGNLATDLLGNPAVAFTGGPSVTIDNVDPDLSFTAPAEGSTFAAGTQVNIQTTPSDATSGLQFTSVFWNDFVADESGSGVPAPQTRTRANGFVGAPVEIARGLNAYGNLSNGSNVRWNALYPGYDGVSGALVPANSPQKMVLDALAVDRAGNATLKMRNIVVTPVAGSAPSGPAGAPVFGSVPSIGNFDVHQFGTLPAYHVANSTSPLSLRRGVTAANLVPPFVVETPVNEDLSQYTAEMLVNGTAPDLRPDSVPDTLDAEGVKFYRQFGTANWARVKLWQTTYDPTIDVQPSLYFSRNYEWTRIDQDFVNLLPYVFINYGGVGADFTKVTQSLDTTYTAGNAFGTAQAVVAPWMLFDNTLTSSSVHKSTSRFDTIPFNAPSVARSLGNWTTVGGFAGTIVTGTNGSGVRLYSYGVRNPSTTAVAGAVYDSVGNYNYTFEGVNRLVDGVAPQDQ